MKSSQRSARIAGSTALVAALGMLAAPGAVASPGLDADTVTPTRVHEIQGTTRLSPLVGERVSVDAVVTAGRTFGASRGFWIQDPRPDDDPRTSEGLFVFTGEHTPDVTPGDVVTVVGTVAEHYPGDPETTAAQSTTELVDADWTIIARGGAVPEALAIGPDTVPDALTAAPGGSFESVPLRPDAYALDFWEAHEGELVSVSDVRLVGPSTDYDELYVTTKPAQNPSARGGTVYLDYDRPNTGVLKIESLIPFSERPFPSANTGDTLTGVTSGPVEYDAYGGYTLMATVLGEVRDNGLAREVTRPQRPGELAVATYNVENLSAVDGEEKFARLAEAVVHNLAAPDVLALEEIQDDNGPAPDDSDGSGDGVVSADETLRRFTDAIEAAGGPRYEWRQIDPEDGADGGQPGGNIRVGFLFDPERVRFVDREGGDATTAVRVERDRRGPRLSVSPGRIEPGDPAWTESRKPLVGEFVFRGRTVFVVANHFASKGGDQPLHGRFQPPARPSEEQRIRQAALVRDFVADVLAVDRKANVVVAGDLNDFPFSPTVRELTRGAALRSLVDTLPPNERYSYVYEGDSQVLDHMLVSRGPRRVSYDVVHVNAEFADQASDHDPQIVRFVPR